MKESFRKFALIFMFSLVASFSFSQDWYVCLGASDDLNEALSKKNVFEKNEIPVFIREFLDYSGVKTYRIFYSETLETKENALMFRNSLLEKPEITKLVKRENIWVTALPKKAAEKKVEPKPVVTVAPKVVEPVEPKPEPILPKVVEKKSVKVNIKDSDTGDAIEGAVVELDKNLTFTTDSNGNVMLPDNISNGNHAIFVTKGEDYVPTDFSFSLAESDVSCEFQYSIPRKVNYDRIKIVLDWGEKPADLDAHVYGKWKHVSFANKKSKNLELDRDDKDGFGPETITIRNPVESETYSYYVYNFTDNDKANSSSLSKSRAKVSVFFGNDFVRSFSISGDKSGIWWHVFDIVNKNEIVVVDEISNYRK